MKFLSCQCLFLQKVSGSRGLIDSEIMDLTVFDSDRTYLCESKIERCFGMNVDCIFLDIDNV
jgi:hypothetical protein